MQEYLAKFRVRVNEVDQFESDKESPLDAACDSVQCVAATTPTVVLTSTQDCSSQTTSTDDMLGSLCPSRLHASLSANLSVCLVEKQSGYEDSTTYAPLELDSMLESYAGRMAYEIALLAEVTNLLESSKDQLTFKSALLLREIQSGFNSILKIGQLVSGPSDQNSLTTILTPDYVNNIGRRITAFMLDLWRTSLMENKELSEAVERVKGQPEILQKLLSCLTPSIQPAGQFAMLKRRLMDMEVDDFLQRVENSQSFERISHERTHQLIEGCLKSYEDCAESLTNELEQLINAEEGEDEELVELSCYVDKFSTVFCPNMEWSPRHFHIFETLKKLAEAQRANLPSTRAYLMCLKAVVNGISSHLQQLVEDSANISGNQTELIAENLRQTTLEKSKISPVDQLTWRHGPQSQNFVLNAILDVQNSLTVAVMSASHQVELSKLRKNLISSNTATHPVILRRPKVVRNSNDEWKRHSANLDAISEDMSGEVDMLRRQLATVEMKLEREQRRLKVLNA